jgi:GNAT superfamily N-acetyltransferase
VSIGPTEITNDDANQKNSPVDNVQSAIEFKRLGEDCNRGAFSCGDREIDAWFRTKALKEHQSNTKGFRVVTTHIQGDPRPIGFYALTMYLEREAALGKRSIPLFSQGGFFPVVRLGWLAVDRSVQRQGYGTIIMGRVIDDFYQIATRSTVYALTLTSRNSDAERFYKRLGFVPYGPSRSQQSMLLPAQSVVELIERKI